MEVCSSDLDGPKLVNPADSTAMEVNMQDTPIEPMSVENVEEFDVWIFESQDLVVSVIPHRAPWKVTTEDYEISQP